MLQAIFVHLVRSKNLGAVFKSQKRWRDHVGNTPTIISQKGFEWDVGSPAQPMFFGCGEVRSGSSNMCQRGRN